MANLKDIRNKIKSVKSIQQVTKAMKMVAAAKLRKSQENMEKARPYSGSMKETINSILPDIDRRLLPVLENRPIKKSLFIVVSADRGMAGGFNANVIKRVEKDINAFGKDSSELICIGKKAYDHFKNRDYNMVKYYVDFWSDLKFNLAKSIGNDIVERYRNKEIDSVHFIYNEFKSVASQVIRSERLFPLEYHEADTNKSIDVKVFMPSKNEIIKTLIPKYINVQIWQYFLESNASEQAARMLAMENATENAGEMITDLSLEYNKARQAAITTEIIEIVSGANALEA
ncbi:MAG: ATP synthase F1 subunit gamma [Candidatus Marinimicrobia bacterium]|nr:ATP synthase F1 subunit gamma [Candidatus Neomarinimicrobiota bacterium]